MRRVFTILSILLAFAIYGKTDSVFRANYEKLSSSESKLNFTVPEFKIQTVEKDGVKYSKIVGAGSVVTNDKGYAELPKMSAALQLDETNDVVIKSADGEYTDIQLEYPLLPSRGTIYRNQDPSTIPYEISPKSVVDEWYPRVLAFNEDPYVFRDVRGVNIYTYPVRYNAVKKTLRVYKNLSVNIAEDITKTTNPLTVRPDYVVSEMNNIYKTMFVNYDGSKFTHQIGEFGEILVIYTSRDATVIQPYIEWKRQKGFKVTATQVATGTTVTTTIANAYSANPNILYVQLVGDWADIKSPTYSITTSADPGDPTLGFVAGSDLYPELIIGRFSAESTADVTTQVSKTVNYEKTPDLSGTWYSTALGIGSPDGSGIGDDDEIDYQHIDVIKENKLLPYTYNTVNEAYSYPTATDVANFVNAGTGLINYCGHGDVTYWVTSSYSNTNINASTNGNKLPFIFSVACVNGNFDGTTCFGEAWLRKSGGGAVVGVFATINMPWTQPMVAQDYINDIIVGGYDYATQPGDAAYNPTAADQRTTYGSILMNGSILMLTECGTSDGDAVDTIETWTIFGDASLQVRTDTPTAINNSGSTILIGSYDATITKTTGGAAVAGALVSLYKDGITYSGFTNSSGSVSIAHGFSVGDDVTVTVSGYNLETEQSVMTVTGDIGGTFSINQTSLTYGNVEAGSTSIKTFTITNSHSTETITGSITTPTGYSVAVASKETVKDVKNALNYAVAPSSSKTFNLTFEPTAGQVYSGNVVVTSSDAAHPTQNIAVTGTGTVPEIAISVTSLSASAAPEATDVKNFNISNTGLASLNYSISTNYTSGKDLKASGGPDAYGYKWKDSDEVGGPVYSWVEISGTGTSVTLADDGESSAINIGFPFNFYGVDYPTLVIAANGALSFTATDITYTNASMPGTGAPNALLAPFWDDLNPSAGGNIYYYYDSANSRFIVEYNAIVNYGGTNPNTFEVLLYESGKIVYQYNTMSGTLTSCTIGIENADGTIGSQVVSNAAYLKSNHAIQFQATPEWLTLDNTSGTVAVGKGSVTIQVACSAAGLELGTYTAELTVTSNDIDEPTTVIPVTFVVTDTATPPNIGLSVSTISATAAPEGTDTDSFNINNSGSSDLNYTITKEYVVPKADLTLLTSTFTSSLEGWTTSGSRAFASKTSTSNLDGTPYAYASSNNNNSRTMILTSASFDGTGCSSLYLDFDHRTEIISGYTGTYDVQYSINGTNYTTVYTTTSSVGAWASPNHQRVLLPNISATMYIRFSGTVTGNGSNWSLDNVAVSGPEIETYSWLTINSATSGTVSAAGSNTINITCDAAGLAEGTYNANITVASNDPDEPSKVLPVEFVVAAAFGAPANTSVVTATASEVNLGWDAVSGAALYRIYRSTDPYTGFAQIATTAAGITTYQDTDVLTGNKYFYYITADNGK